MQRWQRWMTTTGPSYSFGGRTNQDSGSRVWGGAGCGSGGGVWGNGFTSLRHVVFSFVTVSRASVVVFVCTCTVPSLVLSLLLSGFYVRLLHCVEFPLTHARWYTVVYCNSEPELGTTIEQPVKSSIFRNLAKILFFDADAARGQRPCGNQTGRRADRTRQGRSWWPPRRGRLRSGQR